jgi:hypothetical protein
LEQALPIRSPARTQVNDADADAGTRMRRILTPSYCFASADPPADLDPCGFPGSFGNRDDDGGGIVPAVEPALVASYLAVGQKPGNRIPAPLTM